MNNNLLSGASGIFFGIWPSLMKQSGLPPFLSGAVFSVCVLIIMGVATLFAERDAVYTTKWEYAISGGIMAGLGMLAFSTWVNRTSREDFTSLFLICLMSQVVVQTVLKAWSGTMTLKQALGIALTIPAVYFMVKG